jgi:hypothetical protein
MVFIAVRMFQWWRQDRRERGRVSMGSLYKKDKITRFFE